MSRDFSAFLKFELIWRRMLDVSANASQTQIAEMAGVTSGAVSNWKKEEKIPFEPLFRFALSLGVSMHWLLTGEGEMHVGQSEKNALLPSADFIALHIGQARRRETHLGEVYDVLLEMALALKVIQSRIEKTDPVQHGLSEQFNAGEIKDISQLSHYSIPLVKPE